MIDAKELRIGNLLHCQFKMDGPLHVITITGVQERFISWTSPGCCPAPFVLLGEGYRPIPLTPEILEKCGFAWHNINGEEYYYNAAMMMVRMVVADDGDGYCPFAGKISIADDAFRYLHQLQNLFYCLSGQELEVKL